MKRIRRSRRSYSVRIADLVIVSAFAEVGVDVWVLLIIAEEKEKEREFLIMKEVVKQEIKEKERRKGSNEEK